MGLWEFQKKVGRLTLRIGHVLQAEEGYGIQQETNTGKAEGRGSETNARRYGSTAGSRDSHPIIYGTQPTKNCILYHDNSCINWSGQAFGGKGKVHSFRILSLPVAEADRDPVHR